VQAFAQQERQRVAVGPGNARWYRCRRYIAIMSICWPITIGLLNFRPLQIVSDCVIANTVWNTFTLLTYCVINNVLNLPQSIQDKRTNSVIILIIGSRFTSSLSTVLGTHAASIRSFTVSWTLCPLGLPTFGKRNSGRWHRDAIGVEWGGEWGGGIPLPSRLGSLGERRELPQRGPGRSPGRKRIWSIQSVAERLWLKEN